MGRIMSDDLRRCFEMADAGTPLDEAWRVCGSPGTWGVIKESLTDAADLVDVELADGDYAQMPVNFLVEFDEDDELQFRLDVDDYASSVDAATGSWCLLHPGTGKRRKLRKGTGTQLADKETQDILEQDPRQMSPGARKRAIAKLEACMHALQSADE